MVIWGEEDDDNHDKDEECKFPPQMDPDEERAIALLFYGLRLPTEGQIGVA
jgi:hypothetical protein